MAIAILFVSLIVPLPSYAIDPPYQDQMERLTRVLGSLYFLQPLCGESAANWRNEAAELIELDEPSIDRRERLVGAFNQGYQDYARLFTQCTGPARTALSRLLQEAQSAARDIHARFAE